jgi:hypothetical protein
MEKHKPLPPACLLGGIFRWPFGLHRDFHYVKNRHAAYDPAHNAQRLQTLAHSDFKFASKLQVARNEFREIEFQAHGDTPWKLECIGVKWCLERRKVQSQAPCVCKFHNDYYRDPSEIIAEADSSAAAGSAAADGDSDSNCTGGVATAAAAAAPAAGMSGMSGTSLAARRSFVDLIPKQWRTALGPSAEYIAHILYKQVAGKQQLEKRTDVTNIWFSPPAPPPWFTLFSLPDTALYFLKGFILIAPMMQLRIRLCCPTCKKMDWEGAKRAEAEEDKLVEGEGEQAKQGVPLVSAGYYHRVREVMDKDKTLFAISEYYQCPCCNKKFISSDKRILDQVPAGMREEYSVILTHRGGVTQNVVNRLRVRTAGNSPAALHQELEIAHFDKHAA